MPLAKRSKKILIDLTSSSPLGKESPLIQALAGLAIFGNKITCCGLAASADAVVEGWGRHGKHKAFGFWWGSRGAMIGDISARAQAWLVGCLPGLLAQHYAFGAFSTDLYVTPWSEIQATTSSHNIDRSSSDVCFVLRFSSMGPRKQLKSTPAAKYPSTPTSNSESTQHNGLTSPKRASKSVHISPLLSCSEILQTDTNHSLGLDDQDLAAWQEGRCCDRSCSGEHFCRWKHSLGIGLFDDFSTFAPQPNPAWLDTTNKKDWRLEPLSSSRCYNDSYQHRFEWIGLRFSCEQ